MYWTKEQINALAPDANTLKRGEALSSTLKWPFLETNGRVVWGKCKSSGSSLYETVIDLQGPAFKCNCPSRKFPCKHAIGLLILSQSETDGFRIIDELPTEIKNWIHKRDKKTPKKEERSEEEIQKAEAQKDKRFLDRLNLMEQGIQDLDIWLSDVIRMGLANVVQDGEAFGITKTRSRSTNELWRTMAMRMVDAKLPGVAKRIREMALLPGKNTDWPEKVLKALSDLHLLSKGFQQREKLPAPLHEELLGILGINTSKSQLLEQHGETDDWMVIGQFEGTNIDNAAVRRTWFKGQKTGRFALVLEYDYQGAGFPTHWALGRVFKGEMIFYPSVFPLRSIEREMHITEDIVEDLQGISSMEDFLKEYSEALRQNPWIMDYPVAFSKVIPQFIGGQLYLTDSNNDAIPTLDIQNNGWKMVALSGGQAIEVFGEWTGKELHPLGCVAEGRFIPLR